MRFVFVLFALAFPTELLSSELNVGLKPIYDTILSTNDKTALVSQKYSVDLILKHASERDVIFSDAYVPALDGTGGKYQLGKWEFEPATVEDVIGSYGVSCRVDFTIKQVERYGFYKGMPHIIAAISQLKC